MKIENEKTVYDNFIGKKEQDETNQSTFLQSMFELPNEEPEWKQHWHDMPEFEQNDNTPWKKLIVNFRSEEDYREFLKLIDQETLITNKTKSTWFPERDRTKNSLLRWIEVTEE